MDHIGKSPEDLETTDPLVEETFLDLAGGQSPPNSDNFDGEIEYNNFELGAPSCNPEIDVDVGEREIECGEISGSLGSKDIDTVMSPAINLLSGSQKILETNVESSVEFNPSPNELQNPESEATYTDSKINSGPAVLYEVSKEMTKALSDSLGISESESPILRESVIPKMEATDDAKNSVYPEFIENEFLESELENKSEITCVKGELDQLLCNATDSSEQKAVSESNEKSGIAKQVQIEASEGQFGYESKHPKNMADKPREDPQIQGVNYNVEGNLNKIFAREPLLMDSSTPTLASIKLSESGFPDLKSSIGNDVCRTKEHGKEYGEDVSEITTDELELQKREEPGDDLKDETVILESNEPIEVTSRKDVQIGIEGELNLEETAEPLETFANDVNNVIIQETPSMSTEERPLSEECHNKIYSQAYENTESYHSAFHEWHEAELIDLKDAESTHQVTEVQTVEIHSEPVEFTTTEAKEKLKFEIVHQEPKVDLDMAKLASLATSEIVLKNGSQYTIKSELIETLKPVMEEVAEKERITKALEALPTVTNEPVLELEMALTPPVEISEMIPEIGKKKGELTEVVGPLSQSEHENYVKEPQIIAAGESLNEKAKLSGTSSDDKENAAPSVINVYEETEVGEKEPNISDEKLNFDTRYALFVGKILPGHEIYYMPDNKKKVTFRKGGTLDQRQINSRNSSFWDASLNGMRVKSATLGAPRRVRRRPQPKPSVNDDHLFPDSVTPSKVEKTLSEDDTSASNDGEGSRYDVPFMDDDAFVPKRYRSVVMVDDDSSSDSDYSNEKKDLIEPEILEKMDETSPHIGLTAIDGKRSVNHTGGPRWAFGLSICGCLRRRR